MDLRDKTHVKSAGGKKYPMIIRDYYSRYAWMYLISHTSDAADAFAKFLFDLRLDGAPEIVVVRSDDGGELSEGNSAKCAEIGSPYKSSSQ